MTDPADNNEDDSPLTAVFTSVSNMFGGGDNDALGNDDKGNDDKGNDTSSEDDNSFSFSKFLLPLLTMLFGQQTDGKPVTDPDALNRQVTDNPAIAPLKAGAGSTTPIVLIGDSLAKGEADVPENTVQKRCRSGEGRRASQLYRRQPHRAGAAGRRRDHEHGHQ